MNDALVPRSRFRSRRNPDYVVEILADDESAVVYATVGNEDDRLEEDRSDFLRQFEPVAR
jgi:hypothetical protein